MGFYKTKNLLDSFKHAIDGIILVFKNERNLQIHVFFGIIVLIVAFLLKINPVEWTIIILCMTLIYFSEMVNTALESLIDLYIGEQYHNTAKEVKDIAAGAVLFCAIGVSIVGLIIFIPKILALVV